MDDGSDLWTTRFDGSGGPMLVVMPRRTPAIAREQVGVFLAEQAYLAGWTAQQLRTAVRRGDVDRLWRGVYATPLPDTAEGRSTRIVQRSVAAGLSGHALAVSHLAAAGVRAWPWWAEDPRPCVTSWNPALTCVGDVHVHRSPLTPDDTVDSTVGPVTAPGRTVVDLAREFGLESALVTADAALRAGVLDADMLLTALTRAAGRPGVAEARALLDLVDPRSESALESRSRYRIHRAGLPAPQSQVVLLDLAGNFLARVDFFWEEFGVVGEANGKAKYARDRGLRGAETQRATALERAGLVHEPWGWVDLEPFTPTARRLLNAFALARARSGPRRWRVARQATA